MLLKMLIERLDLQSSQHQHRSTDEDIIGLEMIREHVLVSAVEVSIFYLLDFTL